LGDVYKLPRFFEVDGYYLTTLPIALAKQAWPTGSERGVMKSYHFSVIDNRVLSDSERAARVQEAAIRMGLLDKTKATPVTVRSTVVTGPAAITYNPKPCSGCENSRDGSWGGCTIYNHIPFMWYRDGQCPMRPLPRIRDNKND